jgi:ABC-type dipeptide/oligopeptide/nickel transport system ATPase component
LEGKGIIQMSDDEVRDYRWKKVPIAFQGAMNALNTVMTVGKRIVEAILTHEDASKKDAWERAEELLELVGISSGRIKDYPHELSGGMKQRVITAMAPACNPMMVIAIKNGWRGFNFRLP